jgi:hypothetical protein
MARKNPLSEKVAKAAESVVAPSQRASARREARYYDELDGAPKQAKYETLHPVQARISEEKLQELQRLVYRVGKTRTRKDEKITKNTLVRIAVDFLISTWDEDRIWGNDEDEIREAFFRAHNVRPPVPSGAD